MDDVAFGPGGTILTIAIAAGWVAIGAVILRLLLLAIKPLLGRIQSKKD